MTHEDRYLEKGGYDRYGHKWYVRHDCCIEMIPDTWHVLHFDYMKKLGNVFDTREQAFMAGQQIRLKFMNIMLAEAINNNPEIANKICNIISGLDNSQSII